MSVKNPLNDPLGYYVTTKCRGCTQMVYQASNQWTSQRRMHRCHQCAFEIWERAKHLSNAAARMNKIMLYTR